MNTTKQLTYYRRIAHPRARNEAKTMIHADAAFTIGKTHKVCEDYAVTGGDGGAETASVWLCDGCSSSPHTDVGARLLAHAARKHEGLFACAGGSENMQAAQAVRDNAARKAVAVAARGARSLGLPAECVDATLFGLTAMSAPNGGAVLHSVIYGDGALVLGLTGGARVIYRFSYPAGYPFYPAYLADTGRLQQWRGVAGNARRVTKTVLSPDGAAESFSDLPPDAPPEWLYRPATNLVFAAVLSDGIESFHTSAEAGDASVRVGYLDAVRELTAFKSVKGAFVQRRMQAFAKDYARRGVFHNDDVSVAALGFEEEERKG